MAAGTRPAAPSVAPAMSGSLFTRASLAVLPHLPGLALVLALGRFWTFAGANRFSAFDEKRLIEIAALALMLLLSAGLAVTSAPGARAFAALSGRLRFALLVVLALGAASAAMAEYPTWAFAELALYVAIFCATVVVADLYRLTGPAFARAIPLWLVAAAGLYLVYFLVVYFTADRATGLLDGDRAEAIRALILYPNVSNRRFIDQILTWTLPLMVLPLIQASHRGPAVRAGLYLIAAGWWMLLFASDGRGVAVAITVGVVAAVLVMGRDVRRWLLHQAMAAAGGLALYLVIFVGVAPDHGKTLVRVSSGGRFELWSAALQLMRDHPWLGVGPMQFAAGAPVLSAHPHNAVLQWLAEWGIPAALVMVAIIAMAFAAWVAGCRTSARDSDGFAGSAVRSALTAALAGAAMHAMVSGIVVMPLSQLLLIMIAGWAWGVHLESTAAAEAPLHGRWRLFPLVGILAVGALAVIAWRHLPPPPEPWRADLAGPKADQPRFWLQGRLVAVQSLPVERDEEQR